MTAPVPARLTARERHRVLALAREIARNRRMVEESWTRRLRAAGTVLPPAPSESPAESGYLAPGGGFRVPTAQAGTLGSAGCAFFADGGSAAQDEWLYLRGYRYYAADAAMYLPGRVPAAARRWQLIEDGWPRYAAHSRQLVAQAAAAPVPWGHWLAWLAFLEALANDLCAAAWAAAHLQDTAAAARAGTALGAVTGLLAEASWHLWNEPARASPDTWAERAVAVAGDRDLAGLMRALGTALRQADAPPWAVRAIREGDTLWQVAAAFEARWPAIRAAHPGAPVLLVSEAFGAIAVGPLWAAMMSAADRASVTLATSRLSVHEQEMGRVPAAAWHAGAACAGGRVVVHLDDSLFTGRTHLALRQALSGEPAAVYLAALTFDVGTPVNHPEEITALCRDIVEHLALTEELAREPGGQLPAAASMWARRKRAVPGGGDPGQAAAARVLGGSDRLLATLWQRYAPEIGHA